MKRPVLMCVRFLFGGGVVFDIGRIQLIFVQLDCCLIPLVSVEPFEQ